MSDEVSESISKKLNVLIALSMRQLIGDNELSRKRRKSGIGEHARFLANMGLDAKDIAAITGAPITSIRTLLTPSRKT